VTTGSWASGPHTDVENYGFKAGKSWTGDDGKYTIVSGKRRIEWNPYTMVHISARLTDIAAAPLSSNWTRVLARLKSTGGLTFLSAISTMRVATLSNGGSATVPTFSMSRFDQNWTSAREYALLAKLLDKVKSHSYNVGVGLAEVDKFSSSILSTVKNLGFGAADLADGRFETFARRFGARPPSKKNVFKLRSLDFSGRFLEMRYCWTPAIQDAYEAAKAFEAISNGPRKKTYKSSKRFSTVVLEADAVMTRQLLVTGQRTYTYEAPLRATGSEQEAASGEPGSIDPAAGENSHRGAERRIVRRFCSQCSMPCMPVES
jgi:hypothetical protein